MPSVSLETGFSRLGQYPQRLRLRLITPEYIEFARGVDPPRF